MTSPEASAERPQASAEELKSLVEKVRAGMATEAEREIVRHAVDSGIVTASSEGAVGIGGSVSSSTIITGDGNLVVPGLDLNALKQAITDDPERRFLRLYARFLAEAIVGLQYLPLYTPEEVNQFLTHILQMVRTVVTGYYGSRDNLQITANFLRFVPQDTSNARAFPGLRFQEDGTPYRGVLTMTHRADEILTTLPFALPVAQRRDRVLFGAPYTFVTGEITVVGDMRDKAEMDGLLSGYRPAVAKAIQDYFSGRDTFRSFASLCVMYREDKLGVLNIQSNHGNIFGDSNGNQDEILAHIKPFVTLLGTLLAAVPA